MNRSYPLAPAAACRAVASAAPAKESGEGGPPSRAASCNSLLQLRDFPRSVDYGGLMRRLSPFRINTSKKSRHSRIAFITKDFKFTGINTSEKNGSKSSGINTSKKQGRGEGGTSEVNKITHPAFSPRRLICTSRAHHDSAPAGRHKLAFFASRPGREAQGACPPCSWRRSPGYATPTTIYSDVFPEPRRGDTGFSLGTING